MSLSSFEQKILAFLKENEDRSFSVNDISTRLNYGGNKNYKKLVKALAFLERVGEIQLTPNGKFRAFSRDDSITGTFRSNGKGYGFINYDEEQPDLFVPGPYVGEAMDGDTVEAVVIKRIDPSTGKGSEARVEKVTERASSQLVGEFFAYDQKLRAETGFLGYIIPKGDFADELKINILPEGIHPADHTICIVKIKDYPTSQRPNFMTGLVAKEIGHKDEPGIDILSILFQFGIPHEFPENVKEAAEKVPQVIDEKALEGRRDLRNEVIMTIDGADAKDLDDAISLKKNPDGTYQLGVHIADVSHYVTEGSPIDAEAYERGTSVYLTDRVVPMLPQRLSNGICSLHPNEDRLTLTCEMTINQKGDVIKHSIYTSVINSSYRMTYSDVNEILDGDLDLRTKYQAIVPVLEEMAELHHILEEMRQQRGALNFDAPEAKIIVDEDGLPLDIELRERFVGERLIESFMLIANETVAREFTAKGYPFIYRIHEQPKVEKMERFAEFVTSFGVVLRGEASAISPKQLQEALASVADQPIEQVVSTMMLRSMQQAKYSEEPLGHYGLAAEDYTHFTSPIRRYPDLLVHRLIHQYIKERPTAKDFDRLEAFIPDAAIHSSKMERRAVDAERETDALKKAEYMVDKVGEEFDGMISSITSFGIFIQLPNTVEGLVRLASLTDDYYNFNQQHLLLIGERTGKVYRIGQKVKIQVTNVDVAERQIDFQILEADPVEGLDIDALDRQRKQAKNARNKDSRKRKPQQNRKDLKKVANDKGKQSHGNKRKKSNQSKKKFTIRKRSN